MSRKSFQDLKKRQKYQRLNEIVARANENEILARVNEDVIDNNFAFDQQLSPNILNGEADNAEEEAERVEESEQSENGDEQQNDHRFEKKNEDSNNDGDNDDDDNNYDNNEEQDENIGDEDTEDEDMEDEENIYREIRNNDVNMDHGRERLYLNAPLSVSQSMLLILTLTVRHNINMSCLADIINVINLHCPLQHLKTNSLHKFKKFFSFKDTTIVKHYYCTSCDRELQNVHSICLACPRQKNSYFIQLSVIEQLQDMLQRSTFYNKLQERFERHINEDVISDIYDGSVYKYWMNNGFLNNPNNFSLSWYTDGIPVFKSSQISMWPVYLTVNELPFKDRKKKENTLLLGLWFGKKKPSANLFLYKSYQELNQIAQGVQYFVQGRDNPILMKGILLFGIADLVAKNQFMNFIQFNGDYGCPTCCTKGENVALCPRGSIHVYPYVENILPRSLHECVNWANGATPNNPIIGVKGPTVLSILMPNYIEGMGIDRMHAVDGGVIKKLLNLMFDPKYSEEPFSLYVVKNIINSRLTSIKSPHFIHRKIRSVDELLHWKASELKMWCFFYSIPVLKDVMRQDYFEHYLLLVTAVTILNTEKITSLMMNIAEDFLKKFVREFEILYDLQFCSINIHQLLHLVDCVKRLGPLWAFTCFEYENINGQLLKLIHGTGHIDTQIAKSHDRCIKMIRVIEEVPEGPIRDFCLNRKKQVKIIERFSENSFSVGTYQNMPVIPNDLMDILINFSIPENFVIHKYFRLLKNGKLYVSQTYPRNLETQSYIIQYVNNDQFQLGLIIYFIKVSDCNCIRLCRCNGDHYAVIDKIITDDILVIQGDNFRFDTNTFLHICHVSNNIDLIPIENIVTPCVHMIIDNKMFVGIPVNQQELE